MVHGRRVVRQELQQPDPLVCAVPRGEFHPQDHLATAVVGPVVEDELAALSRTLDAPAGEDPRDVDHVHLGVAPVHA